MILQRMHGSRFSTVAREWEGLPAVLLGGGPSLTQAQVALVRAAREADRVRVVAVNDAYLWAPFADILYFADAAWGNSHAVGTPKPMLRLSAEQVRDRFAAFAGLKCSIQNQVGNIDDQSVHVLRNARTDPSGRGIHDVGLSLDPGALITGSNGGWQATNLAVLAGANPIVLLGIDGQPAKDGRSHWSGGHAHEITTQEAYTVYRQSFSAGEAALKAAGVRVINASPSSAIGFEKMTIEEALGQ